MDDTEATRIVRRMAELFPSLNQWVGALSDTHQQAIRHRWRTSLAQCEYDDAQEALDTLATSPDDPWPYPADRERAGAIVARLARERAGARLDAARSQELTKPRRRGEYSGTGIYSRVMAAIAADSRHTPECATYRAERSRCHPACPVPRLVGLELSRDESGLAEDRQAFGCPLCRDTGAVSCLAAADISETVRTGRVPRVRRTYSLPCTCSRGDVVLRQNEAAGKRDVYDSSRDVRSDVPDAEIVTQCRALVESEGGRRVEAFDSWNSA